MTRFAERYYQDNAFYTGFLIQTLLKYQKIIYLFSTLVKTKMRILFQDVILEDLTAMVYVDAYHHWCKNG